MLRRLFCLLLLLLPALHVLAQPRSLPVGSDATSFLNEQLRFRRVRAAQATAGDKIAGQLRRHHIASQHLELFLRLIKTNRALEVWARNAGEGPFSLLQAYPLATFSGSLGPKRHAGDEQVPEGFYEIDRFNPASCCHLSLGLNYPNAADRALGEPEPGGDIFIHGGTLTAGCLPITDAGIEEVYWLAVLARTAGQLVIPVHIFPFPMTQEEMAIRQGSPNEAFWQGLFPQYEYFTLHQQLPTPAQLARTRQ